MNIHISRHLNLIYIIIKFSTFFFNGGPLRPRQESILSMDIMDGDQGNNNNPMIHSGSLIPNTQDTVNKWNKYWKRSSMGQYQSQRLFSTE